jgi:hypothetical protein
LDHHALQDPGELHHKEMPQRLRINKPTPHQPRGSGTEAAATLGLRSAGGAVEVGLGFGPGLAADLGAEGAAVEVALLEVDAADEVLGGQRLSPTRG